VIVQVAQVLDAHAVEALGLVHHDQPWDAPELLQQQRRGAEAVVAGVGHPGGVQQQGGGDLAHGRLVGKRHRRDRPVVVGG
jgi:hypothetical protein